MKEKDSKGKNTIEILSIIAAWLGFALASLGLYLQWDQTRANLDGGVRFMFKMEYHRDSENIHQTLFIPYIIITNPSNRSISLQDFVLDADYGNGYITLFRAYHVDSLLSDLTNKIGLPNDIESKLIYKRKMVISPGETLEGIMLFFCDLKFNLAVTKKYRLTCIDVNSKKFYLYTDFLDPESLMNWLTFEERTGIEISKITNSSYRGFDPKNAEFKHQK